jgi:S-adenosylmethionine/arginine decarboxylase-like enzyme
MISSDLFQYNRVNISTLIIITEPYLNIHAYNNDKNLTRIIQQRKQNFQELTLVIFSGKIVK